MKKIQFEPFGTEDIPRLIGWISSPEFLMQWSGPYFTYPLDEEQLKRYIASVEMDPINRAIFRVRAVESARIVGHIELNNIDWRNQAATVSKVLIGPPEFRGLGIGQKMVDQLLDYAFGELELHRVDLKVFDDNSPAIRCYLDSGFLVEGRLRDFRKTVGGFRSSYLMSILEPDWRAKKLRDSIKENRNE